MHPCLLHDGFSRVACHILNGDSPPLAGLEVDIVHPGRCLTDKAKPRGSFDKVLCDFYFIDYQDFAFSDPL